jgi:hypothetical protein
MPARVPVLTPDYSFSDSLRGSLLGNWKRLAHKESLVPVLGKWGKGKEESGTKKVDIFLLHICFKSIHTNM